jgi:hypothetical protein
MLTLAQAQDIVANINESAHNEVWETWVEADRLDNSDLEEDWDRAEDQRELASRQQSEWFRDLWFDLDESQQNQIKHWIKHDGDLREQFQSWFGPEEFDRVFGESDTSDPQV